MTDTTEPTYPTGPGGMSAAWREYALGLREMVADLGARLDECMPGEDKPCGQDYGHHAMSYMAALQARAELGLLHLHHGEPGHVRLANRLLDNWRMVFEQEKPCDHDDPDSPPVSRR